MVHDLENISRFVLGTAQLGLPYGIANRTGQPEQPLAEDIVRESFESGIRKFDTAQGYGTSETVLGKVIKRLGINGSVKVISKFDPNLDHLDRDAMEKALDKSMNNLCVQELYGMMLHREELLSLWNKGLSEMLIGFVSAGKVRHIGVSVYSPDKAIEALNMDGIDMVQIPTNIFDRRFKNAGVFRVAMEKDKDVYVRSVFLQGLLLMELKDIPDSMSFVRPFIEMLEDISRGQCMTRQEIALGYVKYGMPAAHIVFGAETREQVTENLKAWQKKAPEGLGEKVNACFQDVTERVVNPSLW